MNAFRLSGYLAMMGLASTLATNAAAQSFQGFGFAPGLDVSEARGVSDDGRAVVILAFDGASGGGPGTVGLIWQADTGTTSAVGRLPGANFATGFAISGDGHTAVGASGTWGTPFQAYRFELAGPGGLNGLGDLPGGRVASQAFAVSADGGTVVGFGEVDGPNGGGTNHGFRWTEADGMTDLGTLPGDDTSNAFGLSRDGKTTVGFSGNTTTFRFEPTVWAADGTAHGLGLLAGTFGRASDVSDTGVVVGGSSSPNTADSLFFFTEAFRWSPSEDCRGSVTCRAGTSSPPPRRSPLTVRSLLVLGPRKKAERPSTGQSRPG